MTRAKVIIAVVVALLLVWLGAGLLNVRVERGVYGGHDGRTAGDRSSSCVYEPKSRIGALRAWVDREEFQCVRQFLEQTDPLTLSRDEAIFLSQLLNEILRGKPSGLEGDDEVFAFLTNSLFAASTRWPEASLDYGLIENRLRKIVQTASDRARSSAVTALARSKSGDSIQFLVGAFDSVPESTKISIAVGAATECANGRAEARAGIERLYGTQRAWFDANPDLSRSVRELCPSRSQ
jgi:hypothetical protein